MININQFLLGGRIIAEPEYKTHGSEGKQYARLVIGTSRYIGKNEETGQAKYDDDAHQVTVWDAAKIKAMQSFNLAKGDQIVILCELKNSKKVDENGNTRYFYAPRAVQGQAGLLNMVRNPNNAGASQSTSSSNGVSANSTSRKVKAPSGKVLEIVELEPAPEEW